MNDVTATVFDIVRNSFVDGPGIRTTVFFKGCNLSCAWCHNPESQSPHPQMLFYAHKCTACGICRRKCPQDMQTCTLCGTCALYCPHDARAVCGKTYTVDEVLREVVKDHSFYRASGGGVTCSGGECMLQIDFLEAFLRACRQAGLHTAVDTAGHVPYAFFERILPYTDLFLYDFKCYESEMHKAYTGVGNEQIKENLARLLQTGTPVWIRIPVIAGVNDTEEQMRATRAFLDAHGMPERVELLPYHAMGEHKYAAIGKEMPPFAAPDESRMEMLRRIFQ